MVKHLVREKYHPKTGEFFSSMISDRVRERHGRFLTRGAGETLDDRPMASAIMFSDEVLPEERMRRMMADANARAAAKLQALQYYGGEIYDDPNFDHLGDAADLADEEEDLDPRYSSLQEFIYDPAVGREVPRFFKGRLKQGRELAGMPLEGDGTPPAKQPLEPSEKAPGRKAKPASGKAASAQTTPPDDMAGENCD